MTNAVDEWVAIWCGLPQDRDHCIPQHTPSPILSLSHIFLPYKSHKSWCCSRRHGVLKYQSHGNNLSNISSKYCLPFQIVSNVASSNSHYINQSIIYLHIQNLSRSVMYLKDQWGRTVSFLVIFNSNQWVQKVESVCSLDGMGLRADSWQSIEHLVILGKDCWISCRQTLWHFQWPAISYNPWIDCIWLSSFPLTLQLAVWMLTRPRSMQWTHYTVFLYCRTLHRKYAFNTVTICKNYEKLLTILPYIIKQLFHNLVASA